MSNFSEPVLAQDTQDTYFEEDQFNSQFTKNRENNSIIPESQDFQLIDTSDTQSLDVKSRELNPDNSATVDADVNKKSSTENIINDMFEGKDQTVLPEDEDDEDIVQGTPPHCLSSPSKRLTADIKSLKRRAEFFDNSSENSHNIKKTKIDSELENTLIDSDSRLLNDDGNFGVSMIIQETQDPIEEAQTANFEIARNSEAEKKNGSENKGIQDRDKESKEIKNMPGIEPEEKSEEDSRKEIETEEKSKEDSRMVTESVKESEEEEEEEDRKARVESKKIESQHKINEFGKTESIEDTLQQLGEVMNTSGEETKVEKEQSTESELLATLTDSDMNVENEGDKRILIDKKIDKLPETMKKIKEKSDTAHKSRMSIEVIYDRSSLSQEAKAKLKEVVEIDEDGEKIVLDSSQEDTSARSGTNSDTKDETVYKSCNESKTNSDYSYKSVISLSENDEKLENNLLNGNDKITKSNLSETTDVISQEPYKELKTETGIGNPPLYVVVSDSEGDSMVDEKNKSLTENVVATPAAAIVAAAAAAAAASNSKTLQIEKEINVCVKLKCLLNVDENTREILSKELLSVQCESTSDRVRNCDTSSSLVDISGSDNKDSSPGSVVSSTYPRFSIMSTSTVSSFASSSSSGSSKSSDRNTTFSVPKGPVKQARKLPVIDEKFSSEIELLSKEWKNGILLSTSIFNFVNGEISGLDLQNGVADNLEEPPKKISSSTPEINKETFQRNTKKGRPPKRLQARSARKRMKIVARKRSPTIVDSIKEDSDDTSFVKEKEVKAKAVIASAPSAGSSTPTKVTLGTLRNSALQIEQSDLLLGKEVFAKWSDNNYYPGKVVDKNKSKYKVNFFDGKSKQLIPEFIVPIPGILNRGLSVYTSTKDGEYGPCGIIVQVIEDNDKVSYVIETDEGERITVEIGDIFLTPDQAKLLKEEVNSSESASIPTTPSSLSQVSLDNMLDSKRRSRRNTSTAQTPKSKKSLTSLMNKAEDEPSVSGMPVIKSKGETVSSKFGKTIDSNCSTSENTADEDETGIQGVQKEIPGTCSDQVSMKGPQSRIKGKRNRKKTDDQEIIDLLGPIPESNPKIFEGMSFLLTCASVEGIDRYNANNGDSNNSEAGTENEEEWQSRPFVRERLEQQLIAGGGKVYDNFDSLPPAEYENTKLITNVPNLTAKSLLCLSVGISAYNHTWVIRSCQNNKAVNPSEEKLPAGWSIDRRCYVEMFNRRELKPLTHIIVVIPAEDKSEKEFVEFWSRICKNAGGSVRIVDSPEVSFIEGTLVLTTQKCPKWVIEKANNWDIPLVSTTWLVQSLIEGKILPYDAHKRFKPF